ncbi:hypothetical protein NQ314_008470 [Rhamnusium bicolor]|uniref:Uncharacterized protein n=1 Tax=Rhamnusium bicolor TaxID=1586634 RepID=A0AAV8YAU7_9CUCU|nr:hypothetical protein NQ314_008470 [Rhamnusium bicolor]
MKRQWFCNRAPTPTNTVVNAGHTDSTVQDNSVTSSDDSTIAVKEVGQKDMSSDTESVDDSVKDPEYEATSSSSDDEFEDDYSRNRQVVDDDYSSNRQVVDDDYSNNRQVVDNTFQEDISSLSVKPTKSAGDLQDSIFRKRKQASCYICESSVTNFARHIYRNHKKPYVNIASKKGNYLTDPEEGKPVRTGTESTSYLPCIHCLGFYSSRNLWRHRKQCSENPNTAKSMADTKASAQNFQLNYLKVDPDLRERVFPRMRADKISLVAKKDPLIFLLNRKRPGELQRFLLHTYENSLKTENPNTYEEFSEVVTEAEKALMKNFKRIVIRGKRNRGVPVLFSQDIQEHLNILLQHRLQIMTQPNIYLFGNPRTNEPIVDYKVIKKHLATLTQLINLSESDMEQLASFMGHTLGIHRSSYRLPDDVYQTAKISKLLLLMEKCGAGKFKGKTLDEIDLNMDEDLMETLEEDNVENMMKEIHDTEGDEIRNITEQNTLSSETPHTSSEHVPVNFKKGKKRILIRWTEEQKKIATTFFKKQIEQNRPRKRESVRV